MSYLKGIASPSEDLVGDHHGIHLQQRVAGCVERDEKENLQAWK